MGGLFFYAGFTKIMDPAWSAESYIAKSKMFTEFYANLLQPNILPYVNLANKWGLTLIGAALILGIFVRSASFSGFLLMLLYYIPVYPPEHAYIIDEHIIYALVFFVFMAVPVGQVMGVDRALRRSDFAKKHGWFGKILG